MQYSVTSLLTVKTKNVFCAKKKTTERSSLDLEILWIQIFRICWREIQQTVFLNVNQFIFVKMLFLTTYAKTIF